MAESAPRPMVRGEKVWLRPAERTDIDLFVRWLNDAETAQYLAMRAPLSRASEERWFEQMLERQGRDVYHFVVCRLADDDPIGTCALHEIDPMNGGAGLGVFIGEKALWNRGYGTDALNALVDFGFGELRLERIWLDCYVFNTRARRSYDKAGFAVEGTLRRAFYHRGEYLDAVRMSLLRSEWAALPRPKGWELGR